MNPKYKLKIVMDTAVDVIKEQQQEIERLKQQLEYTEGAMESEAQDARLLREDVKHLKTQAAAMASILQDMVDVAQTCGSAYLYRRDVDRVMKAIEGDAGKDYHNPADVEALRLAREILEEVQNTPNLVGTSMLAIAVQKINKQIGGREDGI